MECPKMDGFQHSCHLYYTLIFYGRLLVLGVILLLDGVKMRFGDLICWFSWDIFC